MTYDGSGPHGAAAGPVPDPAGPAVTEAPEGAARLEAPAAAGEAPAPRGRFARFVALARLGQGGAGRHVAQLGGGTAIVMIVQFGAQYFLNRFYTDVDYAAFGYLVAFGTIVAMAATLRLEQAIPLAGTEEEADDLARFSLVVSTVFSLVLVPVALVLVFGPVRLPEAYRVSVLLAPLVTCVSAGFAVLRAYQSRRKLFRQTSDANIAGTVATAGIQTGLGVGGLLSSGLGVGYALGRLLSTVMMTTRSGLPLRGPVRLSLVSEWRQFPTWILFPALLNAATVGAVTPLVGLFYGSSFAGHFINSQRILSAPVALLGQAVASVFYVRFAAMHREDADTSRDMVRLATVLLGISLAIFVPVQLLSREVFVLLWAAKWETAGYISAGLAPWLMFSFVSSPLSGYATVKNAVRRLFLLSLLEAGLRVPALALGLWWGGPMAGVQAYSLAGLVICLYWTVWVMRLSRASRLTAWRVVALPLVLVLVAWVFNQAGRELVGEAGYVGVSVVFSVAAMGVGGYSVLRALRS